MYKFVSIVTLISAPFFNVNAAETDKNKKQLKPLSEEFLLFLADMEEVDGELMHPVDVAQQALNAKPEPIEGKQVATKSKGKKDEDY